MMVRIDIPSIKRSPVARDPIVSRLQKSFNAAFASDMWPDPARLDKITTLIETDVYGWLGARRANPLVALVERMEERWNARRAAGNRVNFTGQLDAMIDRAGRIDPPPWLGVARALAHDPHDVVAQEQSLLLKNLFPDLPLCLNPSSNLAAELLAYPATGRMGVRVNPSVLNLADRALPPLLSEPTRRELQRHSKRPRASSSRVSAAFLRDAVIADIELRIHRFHTATLGGDPILYLAEWFERLGDWTRLGRFEAQVLWTGALEIEERKQERRRAMVAARQRRRRGGQQTPPPGP